MQPPQHAHPSPRPPSRPATAGLLPALLPALLLALTLALAAPPTAGHAADAPPPDADDPLLLGINYPLTGPYSVEGLDQIRAARMAVDEINVQGGILGRRVRLMPRDSASDTLKTAINVRELIRSGCSMVFGGSSSAVAIAAAETCQRYGVPFFGTLTYSTATTLEDGHRMSFRACNDSHMSALTMADWLNERYADKRFFYITADYTWGWTTEESFRRATHTEDRLAHPAALTPLGETDFRNVLEQADAFRPDVIVLVLFGKDMAYALRQATAMGLKARARFVVPNLTLGMAERAGPEAMQDVVGTLPWTWTLPYRDHNRRGIRFVEDFVRRYRRYPSTSGASAYTIVYEYKAAVERAHSTDPSAVVRALEGHTHALLKDAQTWRALDHQSVQTVYMVRGKTPAQVLADPFRLDFFEIVLEKPGAQTVLPEAEWRRRRIAAGLPPHLEPLTAREAP
ncbi:MAG: ABC transporter substrate-binding protein [Desulfovibrionaceae bacterium]|jgi:ABC-type branched-subunit amino acid transport system substrate-binding protein|nr:ABC transporter substrate-binding protein [Desulfovibrionaceae bacterium]